VRAAWFLRSRQMLLSIRFWLAITGYDSKDESLSNRLLLGYIVVFFGVWGLAVLALITSGVSQGLLMISPTQPVHAAYLISLAAVTGWWLWGLAGAVRRCPMRFSAEDAALVCSTPASRPAVVFCWLLAQWFTTGVPFWGMAVAFGFSFAEIAVGPDKFWPNLPLYLSRGGQFLIPLFLLHFGLLAMIWAVGAYRLRGSRESRGLFLLPLAVALTAAALLLLPGAVNTPLAYLALPVTLPVLSGCGLAAPLVGIFTALGWSLAGAAGLYYTSRHLNLSRAAQESQSPSLGLSATVTGSRRQANSIRLKARLQSSPSSPLPGRPGELALLWKQVLRLLRASGPSDLFHWVFLFALTAGVALAPDWGSRGMALLFWVVQVLARTSENLRADLEMWFLFQPLPFRSGRRILMEILPPVALATLVGWAALDASGALTGAGIPGTLYMLLPLVVLSTAYAAVFDVLRQTRAADLLAGSIPEPGMVGVLLAGVIIAFAFLALNLFSSGVVGVIAAFWTWFLMVALLRARCESSYRKLGK
jgi:hypothetical protein